LRFYLIAHVPRVASVLSLFDLIYENAGAALHHVCLTGIKKNFMDQMYFIRIYKSSLSEKFTSSVFQKRVLNGKQV